MLDMLDIDVKSPRVRIDITPALSHKGCVPFSSLSYPMWYTLSEQGYTQYSEFFNPDHLSSQLESVGDHSSDIIVLEVDDR